jgi:spore coat protein U-like protein
MKRQLKRLMLTLMLGAPLSAYADVTCTVTVTGIAFGGYNALSSASDDSMGNVSVACTPTAASTVSYTIGMSADSGNFTSRQLTSDKDSLAYNIYVDPTRLQVWGDGTAGTSVVSDSYALSQTQVTRMYGIYGRVPGKQNKQAGSYSDVLTVTVTY